MSTMSKIVSSHINALKAKDAFRTQTLSSVKAAVKQFEVDNRGKEVTEDVVITILNKMVKQRQESIVAFDAAGRTDLSEKETSELNIIKEFLPAQASDAEIALVVENAMSVVGSTSMKDMGKIMALVKAELNGKADMAKISQSIKSKLS